MNFRDFYKNKFRYSFEIFPPKTDDGITNLFENLKELAPFDPAYVSVTYGAMGSTRDLTRDLALRIRKELGLTTAFHFTCVGAGREAIKSYVNQLKAEGVELIVALRGDPPAGSTSFVKPADGFGYANELVTYLKSINGFSMAVAGYPEKHIEAPDPKTDLDNLKRKVDAGADIVITQLFFDNADYFDFVDRAQKAGINIPIVPGILPILSLKQALKLALMSGAKIPETLRTKLTAHQNDPDAMRDIGIEHATAQCQGLKAGGAPGIHFYTLNKSHSTAAVIRGI